MPEAMPMSSHDIHAADITMDGSRRKWPFFVAAGLALVLVLAVLWFAWLSVAAGGLSLLYKIGFFGTALLCVIALVVYRKEILTHPEKPFLVLLLAITCTSSWVYDTNEVSWDLESHFWYMLAYSDVDRVYDCTEADQSLLLRDMSEYDVDPEKEQIVQEAIEAPEGSKDFSSIHIILDGNALQAKDDILNELDAIPDDAGEVIPGAISGLYKHVSVLPASLIYAMAGLFGLPFVLRFVLAKLIYAVMYSLIMYFGMRKLRSGKLLFAVIALYPTGIFLAANYSYDFWVNAWCMFAIAGIVGQLQRPDVSIRTGDMVAILAGFFIGLGPKAIYFPLMALAFLIPKSKFASKRAIRIFRASTVVIALLVLFSFMAPFFASSTANASDMRGGGDVNAGQQLAYVLSYPFEYARTCFFFVLDYLSIPNTQNYTIFAAYLGSGSVVVWGVMFCITIFLAVTDTRADSKLMDRWQVRVFVVIVLLGTLVLAMTALYISFTPVGLGTINGFQGRYFLPLLFPLLVFMGTHRTRWPRTAESGRIVAMGVFVLVAAANYWFLWDVYVGLLV